jgi:4-diphosphocytidyl-2-C-methyl-D-erythritol kinase
MILYPPAKINLGLYVTGRRNDGFHDIETLFYPIGLTDIIEFLPDGDLQEDVLTISGLEIPQSPQGNLILKACELMRAKFHLPFLKIHLHKRIPMGAGLGGGSSDGSFMLRGLADLLEDDVPISLMQTMALQMGSDCPIFLQDKPMIGKGRGEVLEEVSIDLSGHYLALFNPGIHVSTSIAFSKVTIAHPEKPLKELVAQPLAKWKGTLRNGFEDSVFRAYPEIKRLKTEIYSAGAIYSSMTGSGSAVYGIFDSKPVFDAMLKKSIVWQGKA